MISVLNNLDKPLKVSNNRISSIKKKTTKDTKIFALIFKNDIFFGTFKQRTG